MVLTGDFRGTITAHVARDAAFANALPDEAATLFLNGDPHTARLILRDLVTPSVSSKPWGRDNDTLQELAPNAVGALT
jgi:hypothetical protein